jgi:hypothetical protein
MPAGVTTELEWDRSNRTKSLRHGVTLDEVEELFRGPLAILPDPAHSQTEERFKAIGRTAQGRFVFIAFTLRQRGDRTLIRPISARYMHRKEIEHYEKEAAKAQNR